MKKMFLLAASSAIVLAACGGEEATYVTEVTGKTGMDIVAKGEEMPACDKDAAGKMIFVADSSAVFYCADKKWSTLNGKDGEPGAAAEVKDGTSCTAKEVDDGIEVSCGDEVVGTIKNGTPGTSSQGCSAKEVDEGLEISCEGEVVGTIKNGTPGTSSQGCSAKEVEEGLEISCEGKVVGTIKNGTPGEAGDNCSIASDEGGVVTLSCGSGEDAKTTTVYKAMCGDRPYDPKENSCLGALMLCDGAAEGQVQFYEGTAYTCESKTWIVASRLEKMLQQGCSAFNEGQSLTYGYSEFTCDAAKKDWNYNFEHIEYGTIAYSGQDYKTVWIGKQKWFAENLNYADSATTPNLKNNVKCYADNEKNCEKFGRLYSWSAAMNFSQTYLTNAASPSFISPKHRGICPEGWHVPTSAEFTELANFVASVMNDDNVGLYLKSTDGWTDHNGLDLFGFNGLPAGFRISGFSAISSQTLFITSSETDGVYFTRRSLFNAHDFLSENNLGDKAFMESLRCLKD